MSERERCETCRYWTYRVKVMGECHRHPPQYVTEAWRQPFTASSDWCGEWRERERDPMDVAQR